jgi:uncharacterized protein (TIGR03083 family)
MPRMDRAHHLAALRRDADGLGAALAGIPLSTPIRGCPGWTAADLLYHVGEVHHFWCTIVAERRRSPDGYEEPARPADEQLLGWYAARNEALIDALTEAGDDTEVWTWADEPADHNVGWVLRRMAQETAVHRWDAETAAGNDYEIEPEAASDGIDEFLFFFLNTKGNPTPWDGSVHIHCTDVAGEWLIVPDDNDQPLVSREHAKGAAALRGRAADLLLALWRRMGLDGIEVVGDADVAARFIAASRLE